MYNRIFHVVILLVVILLWGCQNKDTISISGTIANAGNINVVSFYEGDTKLDSVFLGDGGRFKFERASSQARLLSLEVGKNKYPLILEPSFEVTFETDLHNPESYSVEGSELSKTLKDFAPHTAQKKHIEDSLQSEFTKLINGRTPDEIEQLKVEYLSTLEAELKKFTKDAVLFAENNHNLAGFYAMSTLDPDLAESEVIAYADKIKDDFLDNRYVNLFKEKVAKLKLLAIGQPAPLFDSFTPNNKAVKLTDFKGQYTLVDFWASWCMPCRKENPNLVKLYHQFKDRGFTILGVSLDNNPGSWMRAIKDDNLPWTQVSDLQAWSSDLVIKYQLKSIPASYLLDKEGVIIAKDLTSRELAVFLAELFK